MPVGEAGVAARLLQELARVMVALLPWSTVLPRV